MVLLGRDAELDQLLDLLEVARSGRSAAILVRGDAGMGKSALLSTVAERARATGLHTSELQGIAGEAGFGFAGLQRLLIPFMDGYGELPAPQREALGAAIGLTDSGAPDRFLVGLAALTLLAEADPGRPQLIVIDDAHWLDRESLDTLAFVARRLQAESLVIVFGARAQGAAAQAFDAIETLELGGLSVAATTELLSARSATIGPEVGRQVAAGTQGCPLAILELAQSLSPAQLAGTVKLPDPLPIGDRLEGLYLSRVRVLPAATQQLLLIAAADTAANLATVVSAGAIAGLGADALDAAQSAGLVDVAATVRFRHPLVRSAVYRGAAPAERRRSHALIAAVTDREVEPDAWVWHRANAVSGTDEEVATALEARGLEAERRGRYAACAALQSRAAELTADPRVRARRTQSAATALLVAGAHGEAHELLDQVQSEYAEPLVQAQAQRLRAVLTFIDGPMNALETLAETAERLAALDPQLSQVTYAEGLFLATVTGQFAPPRLVERLAASALSSLGPDESSVFADVIRALAWRLAGDFSTAVPFMRSTLRRLSPDDAPKTFPLSIAIGGMLAMELLDLDAYRRFVDAHAAEQRSRGALEVLRTSVQAQANYEVFDGRFDTAAALFAEAREISRSIGHSGAAWDLMTTQLLDVWRGDEESCRTELRDLLSFAVTELRSAFWESAARHALAVLENSVGNYAAALEAAWPVFDQDPVYGDRTCVEIVEAAHRCGQDAPVTAALARLGERAEAYGTPWAIGLHARSVAVAAGDDAEPHFLRAVDVLGTLPVRTDLARTHLLFGEWLRRQHRRKDARVELTTAHDLFVEMGAPRFAARAARELAATGATVRRRIASSDGEPLTPQEKAIAVLAAGAATNREIAANLFLSPSTVDYHLRKVYRKLGVDSRRKLAAVLGES